MEKAPTEASSLDQVINLINLVTAMNFLPVISDNRKSYWKIKQVWHWPYEAPGIVNSGLYAITIVCDLKDMSQEKYILIWQKI